MNGKICTPVVITVAMALGLSSTLLSSARADNEPGNVAFYCNSSQQPPTIWVQMPDQTSPQVVMTWYSEYLLPEDSAITLCQGFAQTLEARLLAESTLLASEHFGNQIQVCLVPVEGGLCSDENSEWLFSLSDNYRQTFRCLMDNRQPRACPVRSRGPLVTIPGGQYRPGWWPF